MKQSNFVLIIILSASVYFSGCYPFNTGINKDNQQIIIIYLPPESPEPPISPEPCIECYYPVPIPPSPPSSPIYKPEQPVKYRPIEPVHKAPEQITKEERRSSGNLGSRENIGSGNENPRRR
jgi:hypothetical protein